MNANQYEIIQKFKYATKNCLRGIFFKFQYIQNIMKNMCINLAYHIFSNQDTIYALSSGMKTAISIIRVCGPNAYQTLLLLNKDRKFGIDKDKKELIAQHKIKPRFMHFKRFYNEDNKVIDQGLFVHFPPQCSYNFQDIYELHLHGSPAVVYCIFKEFAKMKMRMAERGQFTKRAVINGCIGLHQAEAINDLIRSDTEFHRQVAISHLLGKNMDYLNELRSQLVTCLAHNQAYIDFQEEENDVQRDLFDKTKMKAKKVKQKMSKVIQNYKNMKMMKDGVTIVIMGKPNVGKSTLINQLTSREVSIVNEQPGTTRDLIQATIENDGYRLNIVDTAGIRHSQCQIQQEGVRRAKQKMKNSHIRIVIIDCSQSQYKVQNGQLQIIIAEEDQLISQFSSDSKTIFAINKIDKIQNSIRSCILINKNIKMHVQILLCAEKNIGVNQLLSQVTKYVQKQYNLFQQESQSEIYLTRERYYTHLCSCINYIQTYLLEQRPDFSCEYLRLSIKQLGMIFGRVDCEDVLDVIFNDFCIGK